MARSVPRTSSSRDGQLFAPSIASWFTERHREWTPPLREESLSALLCVSNLVGYCKLERRELLQREAQDIR